MLNVEDKYIGLSLAVASSFAIGTSFVITKKGLNAANERLGFEGDGFVYMRSPLWWAGIGTLVTGEVCNFAAYAFAPAILVTPLGALAVLIGAFLGSYFLQERLGVLGKLGSAICLIGAVIIVLHAPPDEDITTIDEILHFAIQPAFLLYCAFVAIFSTVMIYKIAPKYGKSNPLVYLSICSTVGSVSVMSVKAFGIALKLSFDGHNQFSHPSTYVFVILTGVCILTQMNYFNKALSQFPSSIVNTLYYVTFTTATLCASFLLYGGFNTTDPVNTMSLLCGFLVTFAGVYLLNLSRSDPTGAKALAAARGIDQSVVFDSDVEAAGTDMVSSIQTRMSMQARRSMGIDHRRCSGAADRHGLIRAYDDEAAMFGADGHSVPRRDSQAGLAGHDEDDSHSDSDANEDAPLRKGGGGGDHHVAAGGGINGRSKEYRESIELQTRKGNNGR